MRYKSYLNHNLVNESVYRSNWTRYFNLQHFLIFTLTEINFYLNLEVFNAIRSLTGAENTMYGVQYSIIHSEFPDRLNRFWF
jgi:hypothetical protein